ncbi:hypothetical protein PV326_004477 [Microctonus aethiopoides]|nr:hypothetical protein PV326_004477 [Microctonus aethiopoides]
MWLKRLSEEELKLNFPCNVIQQACVQIPTSEIIQVSGSTLVRHGIEFQMINNNVANLKILIEDSTIFIEKGAIICGMQLEIYKNFINTNIKYVPVKLFNLQPNIPLIFTFKNISIPIDETRNIDTNNAHINVLSGEWDPGFESNDSNAKVCLIFYKNPLRFLFVKNEEIILKHPSLNIPYIMEIQPCNPSNNPTINDDVIFTNDDRILQIPIVKIEIMNLKLIIQSLEQRIIEKDKEISKLCKQYYNQLARCYEYDAKQVNKINELQATLEIFKEIIREMKKKNV